MVAHAPPQGVGRRYLLVVFLFALGNASDALVILRMLDAGASAAEVMLILALFNGVYATLTVPAEHLSDRVGQRGLLLAGYTTYAVLYAGFALTSSLAALLILVALYGAYYGVTDGVGRALVADLAPGVRQGTMFGWYHMLTGIAARPRQRSRRNAVDGGGSGDRVLVRKRLRGGGGGGGGNAARSPPPARACVVR